MKQIRSVTIFLILFSLVFADHGRRKHKRWNHKKKHKVKVVHKQPRLKISLGYNYFWRNWNFGYHNWKKYPSNNLRYKKIIRYRFFNVIRVDKSYANTICNTL